MIKTNRKVFYTVLLSSNSGGACVCTAWMILFVVFYQQLSLKSKKAIAKFQ